MCVLCVYYVCTVCVLCVYCVCTVCVLKLIKISRAPWRWPEHIILFKWKGYTTHMTFITGRGKNFLCSVTSVIETFIKKVRFQPFFGHFWAELGPYGLPYPCLYLAELSATWQQCLAIQQQCHMRASCLILHFTVSDVSHTYNQLCDNKPSTLTDNFLERYR